MSPRLLEALKLFHERVKNQSLKKVEQEPIKVSKQEPVLISQEL